MEREITLSRGGATLQLDLVHGGRASRLDVEDLSLLAVVDPRSPFHTGSFVMAPWAGRIRDGRFVSGDREHQLPTNWGPHAIHGTVVDRPWELVDRSPDSATLDCALDERWPWSGRVRQNVRLGETSAEFGIEVRTDGEPFPASAGWHPWFRRHLARGGPVDVELNAAAMLRRDDAGIATSERVPVPPEPWDDCFDDVRWPVRLRWAGALTLEVSGDTRYAVVYTEPEDAVCVEPQTGPPDAMTLEPVLVTPDRPLTATMSWTWQLP